MVHGWPPFYHDDPMKVYVNMSVYLRACVICNLYFPVMCSSMINRYAKIISGKISYPESFSNSLEDIIAKLCTKNPSKRLGNMKGTAF